MKGRQPGSAADHSRFANFQHVAEVPPRLSCCQKVSSKRFALAIAFQNSAHRYTRLYRWMEGLGDAIGRVGLGHFAWMRSTPLASRAC